MSITHEQLEAGLETVKENVNTAMESVKTEVLNNTKEQLETIKTQLSDVVAEKNELSQIVGQLKGQIDLSKKAEEKTTTFGDSLKSFLTENKDFLSSLKDSNSTVEQKFEMKAVGDMSIAGNFTNSTAFTQQVNNNMIMNPFNRVWLSDILLPMQGGRGSSVIFPKENGSEGGVATWVNRAADKSQVDYDITTQTAFFKWIAGYAIIDRDMLDDVDFMESYLRYKLMISYKQAENNFILNGTTDTNPVTGLLAAADAYDGTFTGAVDRVLDAAWGQIPSNTQDFYEPTHTILHPRAATRLGLNKASGSGEYDLPSDSLVFRNGGLNFGGLSTVKTTLLGQDDFLTLDRNAAAYITRMKPEIEVFVDAALAKRNKVMFRIEGRATLAIFNNDAIVKGTLTPTT